MTTSSAPTSCSITFDDTIHNTTGFVAQELSSVLNDTIVLSNTTATSGANYTYSIGSSGVSTISVVDLNTEYKNSWIIPEEWENSFPEWDRIQKMCKEYPGLKIAFEKFKTTYNLVKDDYDTPKDQRKIP